MQLGQRGLPYEIEGYVKPGSRRDVWSVVNSGAPRHDRTVILR
jgi:hypothetical protein